MLPLVKHVSLSFSLVTAILFGAVIIYWIIWRNSRFVRLIEKIPGPKPQPFLGNTNELMCDNVEFMQTIHFKWVREYGNIYRVWAANRAYVLLAAPELVQPLLNSQTLLTKGDEYHYFYPWMGNSCAFLTAGEKWRTKRRLLTPAFHFQILTSFFDVFNEQSRVLLQKIGEILNKNPEEEINVFPLVTTCTLDIICETSMGKKVRSQEETSSYVKALHKVGQLVMERSVRPWLDFDFTFNLSSFGRENRKTVKILHEFSDKVVGDRKAQLDKEWSETNKNEVTEEDVSISKSKFAFLDLLLKAAKERNDVTDVYIRQEVDANMFAGHDTTASTITWFLYCIARHPEAQQRCIQEIDEIFGNSDRFCTTQDTANMKYLECCIKETLRLYPSVPAISRKITQDTVIGDYTIPTGTSVGVLIYAMHHNPSVFKDPELFLPERFLTEESSGWHPYAYIPFSAGPRNCLGQKYAMLEVKVVLSTLLRRYRFSTKSGDTSMEIPAFEVVIKPRGSVPIIVTPR